MKNIRKYSTIISIAMTAITVVICTTLTSCSKDDDPSAQEIFLNKLAGDWTLTSGKVLLDGMDVTGSFPGLRIVIKKNRTFTTTNPVSPIWPASGSFTLQESNGTFTSFLRNDGMSVSIEELTSSSVVLGIQYTSPVGRSNSVSGQYKFYMTR
jgi:hypothetical protein